MSLAAEDYLRANGIYATLLRGVVKAAFTAGAVWQAARGLDLTAIHRIGQP